MLFCRSNPSGLDQLHSQPAIYKRSRVHFESLQAAKTLLEKAEIPLTVGRAKKNKFRGVTNETELPAEWKKALEKLGVEF